MIREIKSRLNDGVQLGGSIWTTRKKTIELLREISKYCIDDPPADKNDVFYDIPKTNEGPELVDGITSSGNDKLDELIKQLEKDKSSAQKIKDDIVRMVNIYKDVACFGNPFKCLLNYGSVYEYLTVTGIHEFGLTVTIGSTLETKSDTEEQLVIERGLDPNRLATALEEELDMLNYYRIMFSKSAH